MKFHLLGCSHRSAPIQIRERLAFDRRQVAEALSRLRRQYPQTEFVVLSTCNRVEFYLGSSNGHLVPARDELVEFVAEFHRLPQPELAQHLTESHDRDALRHLFLVAASLDSMVMGEAQILSQVKQAYQTAIDEGTSGPVVHAAFQAAIRSARRVCSETSIHQNRVSIPSVAVADFAKQIFQRFDDKQILVVGAGEMAEETLRYLVAEGAQQITLVNRHAERAAPLAATYNGRVAPWEALDELLVEADLVVSTTGAREPIVTLERFQRIEARRFQRNLVVLDLAVPRDFDPRIGDAIGVYLYSIDDLQAACEANRQRRRKQWPHAVKIVEQELERFLHEWNQRSTVPTIRSLREQAEQLKKAELERLVNKLGPLDPRVNHEIQVAFDRLVNKLLHQPLESLRDEAKAGTHHQLLDALRRLFQLDK